MALRLLEDKPQELRLLKSFGDITKDFEGFMPDIYKDTVGKRSIGYGFNLDEPFISKLVPHDVSLGKRPISRQEADSVFSVLYSKAKKDAINYFGEDKFKKLPPEIQETITDMSYNLGANRLSGFKKFKSALREGDTQKAAAELKNSKWFNQVGRRSKYHYETLKKTPKLDLSLLNIFQPKEAFAEEEAPSFITPREKVIPEIRAARPGERRFLRPLTDEEKAAAVVDLTFKERGEQVPRGLRLLRGIESPEAQAITQAALAPEYTVLQGIRGAIDKTGGYQLIDRIKRGVLASEDTKRFYEYIPKAETLPRWAKITANIGEDIIALGGMGLGRAALRKELLMRNISRKIETASEQFASEGMSNFLPAGYKAEEALKAELKTEFRNRLLARAVAPEVEWGVEGTLGKFTGEVKPSMLQNYAKRQSFLKLVGDELKSMGEAGEISLFRKGDVVKLKRGSFEQGVLNAVVKSIEGDNAIVEVAGKQLPVALSKLELGEKIDREIPEQITKWMDKGITIANRGAPIRITQDEAQIKDISGKVVDLPKGHEMTPFKLSNGKIWLHDGKDVVVESGQLTNLENKNLVLRQGKFDMPEGVEEVVKGSNNFDPYNFNSKDLVVEKTKYSASQVGAQVLYKGTPIVGEFEWYPGETEQQIKDNTIELIKSGKWKQISGNTKFSQYQLPGGENYREVLIKAPYQDDPNSLDRNRKDVFQSSHWDEPNVISHARINDRTTPDGKKVLFIEEIQSDWARKFRKEGAIEPRSNQPRVREDENVWVVYLEPTIFVDVPKNRASNQQQAVEYAITHSGLTKHNAVPKGVPSHPLLKNWQEFTLKQLVKKAVEGGYDYISWTTGEQQAERYDLAKQIDKLFYNPDTKVLGGFRKGESIISETVEPKDLEKYIGKEPARKILETPKNKDGEHYLSGQDLKVGGEWANNLYDKQIPNILKDLTKREVESVKLLGADTSNIGIRSMHPENDITAELYNKQTGKTIDYFTQYDNYEENYQAALKHLGKGKGFLSQSALKITPELKARVIGQPMAGGKEVKPIRSGKKILEEAKGKLQWKVGDRITDKGGQKWEVKIIIPPDIVKLRGVGGDNQGVEWSPLARDLEKEMSKEVEPKEEPREKKPTKTLTLNVGGQPVKVDIFLNYMKDDKLKFSTHHLEFHGEAISSTGYRSEFVNGVGASIEDAEKYAKKLAEELHAQEIKDTAKQLKKADVIITENKGRFFINPSDSPMQYFGSFNGYKTLPEAQAVLKKFVDAGIIPSEKVTMGVTHKKSQATEKTPKAGEGKVILDEYRKSILPEYNTNKEIIALDALVEKIRELNPKDESDAISIKEGYKYEAEIGYPHSLGEQGNAQSGLFYKDKPTIEELKKDIIDTYKEFKEEVNKEVAMGIVAKSGRDEAIEEAIDKVLEKPSQKEIVKQAVTKEPKAIKKVAEETGILEPNVRRILGVGAKEGVFSRVDKGVYILNKDGQDIAYIHSGDALEVLPKLARESFKADMIFLDIPYKTPAVTGGNRGIKYDYITPEQFNKVVIPISLIIKDENTPVIYMYSQARSGLKEMQKYTDVLLDAGFKPIAKGEYTKLQKDGITRVRNMRGDIIEPEGIILFTYSGEFDKEIPNLNFKLIRPKGYQTEKPAEMLKALIETTTEEGEVVLDPFAGSGVTGAEAIKTGRGTVLIEKNPETIEKFIKPRLKKAAIGRIGKELKIQETPSSISKEDLTPEVMNKLFITEKQIATKRVLEGKSIKQTAKELNEAPEEIIKEEGYLAERIPKLKLELEEVKRTAEEKMVQEFEAEMAAETDETKKALKGYLAGKLKPELASQGEYADLKHLKWLFAKEGMPAVTPDEMVGELQDMGFQVDTDEDVRGIINSYFGEEIWDKAQRAVAGAEKKATDKLKASANKTPSERKKIADEMRLDKLKVIAEQLTKLADIAPKLITQKQIAYIHILKDKQFLTDQQYARLKKVFTGKTSLRVTTPTGQLKKKPMMQEEGRELAKGISLIVPRKPVITGQPPIIPRTKALVLSEWSQPFKDLTEFQASPVSGLDPLRTAELVDGKSYGAVRKFIVEPAREAERRWKLELKDTLDTLTKISKGMRSKSELSKLTFKFIEKTLNPKEEKKITPLIKNTAEYLRKTYDSLLVRINEKRALLKRVPILKRQDYITHIQELSLLDEFFQGLSNVPDDMVNIPAFSKSNSPFFRFALQRLGGMEFELDAIAAFESYISRAYPIIYNTDVLKSARPLVERLPSNAYKYFSQYLDETMALRPAQADKLVPKSVLKGISQLRVKMGKGAILGNVASVFNQMFTLPNSMAAIGPKWIASAALKSHRNEWRAFTEKYSKVLQGRIFEIDFDPTLLSKVDKALGFLLQWSDKEMVRIAWGAQFEKSLSKGVAFEQAIREADDIAFRTQSGFNVTDLPPAFRSRIASSFLQFQNTVNNGLNFLRFDLGKEGQERGKWGVFKAALMWLGTLLILNRIYKSFGVPSAVDEWSDVFPLVSMAEYGLPVTYSGPGSLLQIVFAKTPQDKARALKSLRRAIFLFLPAGNQIRKSLEGIYSASQGGKFNKKGRLQFPIRGFAEKTRSVLFGPYGTKAGQRYIKKGFITPKSGGLRLLR